MNELEWETPNEDDAANEPENRLSFLDSWKSNKFELGAAGAITGGAMYLGLTGRMPDLKNGAINAAGRSVQAVSRYLNNVLPQNAIMAKDWILGAARKYSGKKQSSIDPEVEHLKRLDPDFTVTFKPDEVLKRTKQLFEEAEGMMKVEHELKVEKGEATGAYVPRKPMTYYAELAKSQIKQEAIKNSLPPSGFNTPLGSTQSTQAPTSMIGNAVGAALTGVGFGAGLTAFHGLESMMRDPNRKNDYKQRDRHYEVAGSTWNKRNQKQKSSFHSRGDRMPRRMISKEASVFRHLYDGISPIAENTPKAIASGLGFTGVSLGTAALLKNHPDLLKGNAVAANAGLTTPSAHDPASNPRIIIELGPQEQTAPLTRLAAHAEPNMQKQANIKHYFQSLIGHPTAMRQLNDRISGDIGSYYDEAADMLKQQDVAGLAKQKYGQLYDENPHEFIKNLFQSQANQLKQQDILKREKLKDDIAKARVLTAGGVGLGGLATAAYLHQPKGGVEHVQ